MKSHADLNPLLDRFRRHDRHALSRLITLLDDGLDPQAVFQKLDRPSQPARTVVITGAGGVGKSTLIGGLIRHLRTLGLAPAVLACDPASRLTGGALLGDRIRMDTGRPDDSAYIRSLSTRGDAGGLSHTAAPITRLLECFGFDVILIETIGIGQDQDAAVGTAQVMLWVTHPLAGDEIQWQKAGVIEYADLIVVNKADLGGADTAVRKIQELTGKKACRVTAEKGEGLDKLWDLIAAMPSDD